MKRTSFTNMCRAFAVLLLVGLGLSANAQSVSITNQSLGLTACGGTGNNVTSYTFSFPAVAPGTNVLGSVTLNYCPQSWTSDWDFDIISPAGVITNIVNPTGAGAAGGVVNATIVDQSTCNAAFPLATTALNSVGNFTGTLRSAVAFPNVPVGGSAGVWQLRVRNIFTGEPAFLTNATLNFVAPGAYTAAPIVVGAVTGGSVVSTTGPVVTVGGSTADTLDYVVTLTGGSAGVAISFGPTAFAAPATAVTTGVAAAGPFAAGTFIIRTDQVCNTLKNIVYRVRVLAPPQVICPPNQIIALTAGQCSAIAAWSCPTSSVAGSFSPLAPNTQNAAAGTGAIDCGLTGGVNAFGRMYNTLAPAIASGACVDTVVRVTSVVASIATASATNANGHTIRIYSYTGGFSAPGTPNAPLVYGGNLILVGSFTAASVAAGANTFTGAPINIQRNRPYYVEVTGATGTFSINLTAGASGVGPTFISSTACQIGGPIPNPTNLAGAGLAQSIPFTINLAAPLQPVQTAGPAQGTNILPGITSVTYQVTDATGATATCSFSIEVRRYTGFTNIMSCNAVTNISLDASCTTTVTADMILSGDNYSCYSDYIVMLSRTSATTGFTSPAILTAADVNKRVYVKVTDPRTGLSCWGEIFVEDKLAPIITNCGTLEIPCTTPVAPVFLPIQTGTRSASAVLTGTSADTILGVAAATTNFTINVSGAPSNAVVSSLSVPLKFNHTFVSDLVVTLIAPNGTSARILSNQCGGNNNVNATFDANGPNPGACVVSASTTGAPCTNDAAATNTLFGNFAPFDAFSVFNGSSVNGNWTLRFVDPGAGDAGRLCAATLNFGYALQLPYAPTFTDGCGVAGTPLFSDVVTSLACTTGNLTKTIARTWRVTDASGNTATCVQTINVRRATLADVVCPPSLDGINGRPTLSCDGIKQVVADNYTVIIPNLVQVMTQHMGWALDCGPGVPTVVSQASGPVQNFTCDQIPFYQNSEGLIVRAKLTPTNVYLPRPSINLNWAKLANGYPSPTGAVAYLNGVLLTGGVLITGANANDATELNFAGMGAYRYNVNGTVYYFMGSGEPGGAGLDCGTIGFSYTDSRIDVCGNSFKILREWKIIDWCTSATQTCLQIVKVLDTKGPAITCPANFTASTDPTVCTGTVVMPEPTIVDNCDAAPTYDVSVPANLLGTVTRLNPGSTPAVFGGFPIGSYVVTYTATDNCGNTSSCTTTMRVEDLVPPVPICREITQISLGLNGTARVPATTFNASSYDNCGIVRYQASREIPAPGACRTSVQGYMGNGTGVGTTSDAMGPFGYTPFRDSVAFFCCDVTDTVNVILRVYDRFNNVPSFGANRYNDCMVQVYVEDKLAPAILCPANVTVECGAYDFQTSVLDTGYMNTFFGRVKNSITERGTRTVNTISLLGVTVPVALLDGYAVDNCDVTITQTINNGIQGCGDGVISRTFTARDKGGRSVSCTQTITVVNRKPFYITDVNPNNSDPNDGVIWPQDITLTVCGSQANPDSLAAAGNPNAFPQVFEDGCDIVAVSYTDEIFTIAAPACYKIFRKWSIIDWCAYNRAIANPSAGITWRWNYTQVIKILNNVAPSFTSGCQDQSFCQTPTNCAPTPITLAVTATDDCTGAADIKFSYTIDPFNDGSAPFISGVGSSVNATFPFGTHRITWSVEDGCGNVRTCSYIFKVEECKKPTPVCHIALADIMPSTGTLPIAAAHINNSSYDNCAVQYIKVRRTYGGISPCPDAAGVDKAPTVRIPEPPAPTGNASVDKAALNAWATQWLVNTQSDGSNADTVVFTCADRVCGGGVGTLQLWIGDNNGNWDYCSTAVTLQNNMNAPGCEPNTGGGGGATIAGVVKTETGANVQNVKVSVTTSNALQVVTGNNGLFNWASLFPLNNSYTVTPQNDLNASNGVNTFDIGLISRHILGLQVLGSPYKIIAADVNKSGTISTIDLVQLRKIILHVDENFQSNTSWRFVPSNYSFPDPTNPLGSQFPEVYNISNLQGNMTTDFVGIKVGDVNGNVVANNLLGTEEHNTVGDLTFNMNDVAAKAGETFTFDVKAKDLAKAQGYQFTMNFDQKAMQLVEIKQGELSSLTADNFGIMADGNAITTSWNGKAEGINPEAVLFSMTFRANRNLQLSRELSIGSQLTRAEAYTKSGDELNVVFAFNGTNGTTVVSERFELFQNTPNPVRSETVIGFNLPTATTATLSIFDISGKLVKSEKIDGVKGYNQIAINRSDLGSAGVMKYTLSTSDNTATKSLIIVE